MKNYLQTLTFFLEAYNHLNWDKEKMQEYQNSRIKKIIKNAYENVPYYNKIFKENNLRPSDIKNKDDLLKIPITSKNDLKNDPMKFISTKYELPNLKKHTTSGSTGTPLSVFVTKREEEWRQAIHMRTNIFCGQKPWDKWVALTHTKELNKLTYYRKNLGIYSLTEVPVLSDNKFKLDSVKEINPDILGGFSSSLFLLAKEAYKTEKNTINPRIIFTTGDLLASQNRNFMENVFNSKTIDLFGCSELDRTAWQCPEIKGYHMDVDSVVSQFIDRNGDEVDYGERGQIVYTSLFNEAMPLIRYGIGDVGIPTEESCGCGNNLPCMKLIEGRTNSFIILDDEVIGSKMYLEILKAFMMGEKIDQYRVHQYKNKKINIQIKKKTESVNEDEVVDELLKNIRDGYKVILKNREFDESMYSFSFLPDIPKSDSGKVNVINSDIDVKIYL